MGTGGRGVPARGAANWDWEGIRAGRAEQMVDLSAAASRTLVSRFYGSASILQRGLARAIVFAMPLVNSEAAMISCESHG